MPAAGTSPPRVSSAPGRRRGVALICMPFADARVPSVALGTLAATLRRAGHRCDVHHLHVDAAAAIGLSRYLELAANESWKNLIGEWLFSHPRITPGSADDERMRAVLARADPRRSSRLGRLQDLLLKRAVTRSLYDRLALGALRPQLDLLLQRWLAKDWSRYDVVGFTVAYQQLNASLRLALLLREAHPHLRVVLGGSLLEPPTAAVVAERYPWLSALFSGYAEGSLLDYLDEWPAPSPCVIYEPPGPLELDTLPVPEYDDYLEALTASGLRSQLELRIPVELSRGCWWGERRRCAFCGLRQSLAYQQKSVERALEELQTLSRHGEPLQLVDNLVPRYLFSELLPRMEQQGIRVRGGVLYTRANLSKGQLRQLVRVGFSQFSPGIESLSSQILEGMSKGIRAAQIITLLRRAEELGFYPGWSLLCGFPDEEPDEYAHLARLIPRLSHLPGPVSASPLVLLRFSPLYERRTELGLTGVRPSDAYALAFGDHPRLEGMASVFSFVHEDASRDPARYARDALESAMLWRELRQLPLAPRCEVLQLAGRRLLVDTRRAGRVGRSFPRLRWLGEAEWALLEILERPHDRDELDRRWGSRGEELSALLDGLIDQALVLDHEGQLVRLVVVRDRSSLLAELLRVSLQKARWLTLGGMTTYKRFDSAGEALADLLAIGWARLRARSRRGVAQRAPSTAS
jgi:ribosomal peptide maturation radical SAM protein 1